MNSRSIKARFTLMTGGDVCGEDVPPRTRVYVVRNAKESFEVRPARAAAAVAKAPAPAPEAPREEGLVAWDDKAALARCLRERAASTPAGAWAQTRAAVRELRLEGVRRGLFDVLAAVAMDDGERLAAMCAPSATGSSASLDAVLKCGGALSAMRFMWMDQPDEPEACVTPLWAAACLRMRRAFAALLAAGADAGLGQVEGFTLIQVCCMAEDWPALADLEWHGCAHAAGVAIRAWARRRCAVVLNKCMRC